MRGEIHQLPPAECAGPAALSLLSILSPCPAAAVAHALNARSYPPPVRPSVRLHTVTEEEYEADTGLDYAPWCHSWTDYFTGPDGATVTVRSVQDPYAVAGNLTNCTYNFPSTPRHLTTMGIGMMLVRFARAREKLARNCLYVLSIALGAPPGLRTAGGVEIRPPLTHFGRV